MRSSAMVKWLLALTTSFVLASLSSCNQRPQNQVIQGFNVAQNLSAINSVFEVNTDCVITNGIVFPKKQFSYSTQKLENSIHFSFSIKKGGRYFYKIFYQNESYKFEEEHPFAHENFYGSWYDTLNGFKEISNSIVSDSFIIAGNPRFESKYCGAPLNQLLIDSHLIKKELNSIHHIKEWREAIEKKAIKNNITYQEQLYLDAIYVLSQRRNHGSINHPWKRNPRMGKYSVMLVVCTEEALKGIPKELQFIHYHAANGSFINPYTYFLHQNLEGVSVVLKPEVFSLKMILKPGNGIYVDPTNLLHRMAHFHNTSNCGSHVYRTALFEQFFSSENKDFTLRSANKIINWKEDVFNVSDYLKLKQDITTNPKMQISSWIKNVDCPCKEVQDHSTHLSFYNPASKDLQNASKNNVGVKSRVGVTYGKITALVELPRLLNGHRVWHGITNSIWLFSQDLSPWNNRRESAKGYLLKEKPQGPPESLTPYSEIDFEIVKTNPYWPESYYKKLKIKKIASSYDPSHTDSIIVAMTNWDLANHEPENFSSLLFSIEHQDREYSVMRWFKEYQAITIRTQKRDQDLFDKPFYFQIEWTPTEIIWRIGASLSQMEEVGYMSEKYTSIPNNQMIMIITQEYHLSDWWPVPVFEQEYLPFLSTTNQGKLYQIIIE